MSFFAYRMSCLKGHLIVVWSNFGILNTLKRTYAKLIELPAPVEPNLAQSLLAQTTRPPE